MASIKAKSGYSVAGSETTASSLASLVNMLLRHPKVYAKLTEEIHNTFKSENDITLEVAHSLPYLSACIEENLRIFPPAPIGFLREIQKGGDMIDGSFVPEGVSNVVYDPENNGLTLDPRPPCQSAHGVLITMLQIFRSRIRSSRKDGLRTSITPTTSLPADLSHWDQEAALVKSMLSIQTSTLTVHT